jgi:hypothetical protein
MYFIIIYCPSVKKKKEGTRRGGRAGISKIPIKLAGRENL